MQLLHVIDAILDVSLGAGGSNWLLLLLVCFFPGLSLKTGGSMSLVLVLGQRSGPGTGNMMGLYAARYIGFLKKSRTKSSCLNLALVIAETA